MVIPQTGALNLTDYASLKQVNEYSKPGIYGVTLARRAGDVTVRLTADEKVGVHEYSFFTWDEKDSLDANLIFDVAHTLTRGSAGDARCNQARITRMSADEISGSGTFSGGWGGENPYEIFFYAKVDVAADSVGIWNSEAVNWNIQQADWTFTKASLEIPRAGAVLKYRLPQKSKVLLKVSISVESIEAAKAELIKDDLKTFDDYRLSSASIWEDYLSKIQVSGGLPEQQVLFYSALRNTLLMPTQVVSGGDEPDFWDHYCLWDVHRTVMPLHTLIYSDNQRAIINSLLNIYEKKGWLPDGWVAGDYAQIQGGTTADIVIADAIIKDLGGFDEELALEAIVKNASQISDSPNLYGRYLKHYRENGYVLPTETKGVVSRTLEYAYGDFVISQAAEHLGKEMPALRARSYDVFKLFHKVANQFWAKDVTDDWLPGIRKKHNRRDTWNAPYFYETAPDIYSTYVPHAMDSLIALHGGKDNYEAHLDQIFKEGFELENEPAFLLPYQYLYTNAPWKTAERIHEILASFQPSSEGWPGQDDSGALSAWYVWSAMGIFPVAGQDIYLIGIPLFDRSVVRMEGGDLEIIAHGLSENHHIKSVSLNGHQLEQFWLSHDEIIRGGQLIFEF